MLIVGLTGLFVVAVLLDLPLLLTSKKKKKLAVVYLSILGLAYGIACLQIINKAPPSPSVMIEFIVRLIIG